MSVTYKPVRVQQSTILETPRTPTHSEPVTYMRQGALIGSIATLVAEAALAYAFSDSTERMGFPEYMLAATLGVTAVASGGLAGAILGALPTLQQPKKKDRLSGLGSAQDEFV